MICELCGIEVKNLCELSKHIKKLHKEITVEEYYISFLGEEKRCKKCGKRTPLRSLGKGFSSYCNLQCYYNSKEHKKTTRNRKGQKNSNQHRKKISDSLKGRVFSKEHKVNISKSSIGKSIKRSPLSKEIKKKISKSLTTSTTGYPLYKNFVELENVENIRETKMGILEIQCAYCGKWHIPMISNINHRRGVFRGYYKGEYRLYCSEDCKTLCPTYNQVSKYKFQEGQGSREVQPELRQLVMERDGWTCQKCGQKGGKLQCHHISPVKENPVESADVDNCTTLCLECHKEVHKIPGCGYQELAQCL